MSRFPPGFCWVPEFDTYLESFFNGYGNGETITFPVLISNLFKVDGWDSRCPYILQLSQQLCTSLTPCYRGARMISRFSQKFDIFLDAQLNHVESVEVELRNWTYNINKRLIDMVMGY